MAIAPNIAPMLMGLAGVRLSDDERAFIAERRPLGFLLFARNIESAVQVKSLCDELAELSATPFPFIAVDQEGGRVQRISFAGRLPPAKIFGDWYLQDPAAALEACTLNALFLTTQLRDVGANWLLGPVLDLALPETHGIIGDRAFSSNPSIVAELGKAYLTGIQQGGGFGCIKHAPGHGRAMVDSHAELPQVDVSVSELQDDFYPFRQLAPTADFMMTAHIRFGALDPYQPVTTSASTLAMMRETWNFKGLMLADDLGMKALEGNYVSRAQKSLAAGCDVIITAFSVLKHGMAGTVFDEENYQKMKAVELPPLTPRARNYLENLVLPPALEISAVAYAKSRFTDLWSGGPARMGYTLDL